MRASAFAVAAASPASPCSRKAMRAWASRHPPGLATPPIAKESEPPRDELFAPLVLERDQRDRRGLGVPVRSSPSTVATPWFQPSSAHCHVSSSRLPSAQDFTVGRRDPLDGEEDP